MATPAPERPSVFGMQHYTMHAKGIPFVQPNEARHIQTSVSGIRQKTRRTFPARDEHLAGVAGTGAIRPHRQQGFSGGGGCIFTKNAHDGGAAPEDENGPDVYCPLPTISTISRSPPALPDRHTARAVGSEQSTAWGGYGRHASRIPGRRPGACLRDPGLHCR